MSAPRSEAALPVPASARAPVWRDAAVRDPADRGTTILAQRVVEKVAARAAGEIEQVSGLQTGLTGRVLGRERIRASAELEGSIAVLRLTLAAAFPAPLVSLTRAVRANVTERVQRLCGLRVDHVDITVATLHAPGIDVRRVE